MGVQSTTSILLVLVFPGAYFHEGEVQFRGLCIHFDQATNPFQLSLAPSIFFALAQTIDNCPCTRHACRHDERKIRTTCGKRPVTIPTDHPPSTGQTPRLSEDRSVSPGGSCQDGSDLETSAFPRPARDGSREGRVSSSACSPKHRSKARSSNPRLSCETITLIQEMAANNRLWGAERIRGERAFAGYSSE
jgi:hypothetical protein